MSFYFVQYVIYSLLTTKFKHFQLPYFDNYFKMLLVKMWADGDLLHLQILLSRTVN